MIRVENGVIYYAPYGEEEKEIGNISEAEVLEGYLSIGGNGFPLEHFNELKTAWDELYPNGKPVPEVPSTPRTPTEIEQLWELVGFALGVPTRKPSETEVI